jgi:hypothetical protein
MAVRVAVPLTLFGSLALASCHGSSGGSPTGVGVGAAEDPGVKTASAIPLPPSCIELLEQLECWLRAAGNEPGAIAQAIGNARASFEARPEAAESCERVQVFRAELIASAGCAHPGDAARNLPPSAPAPCRPGEHFFVRRDGHVSGCHRDCTVAADCPVGTSCTSVGSAAGGPIEEPFCE